MNKTFHILNGDALKDRFPEELKGKVIVVRECLVDGPVKGPAGGEDLSDFYDLRARFLSENYGGTIEEYHRRVAREFEALRVIPQGSAIYLWFEDDLFCQVNLWFVFSLLSGRANGSEVYLVRPPKHTPYGFGGLSEEELMGAFKRANRIKEIDQFDALWQHYRNQDLEKLLTAATELQPTHPFILYAVQAHVDRLPKDDYPGRPKQALVEIMRELDTREFGPVFREFCRSESIYGFGDLQVKRLLDELEGMH